MAKTVNVGPPGFDGLAPYLAAAASVRGVAGELAGKANLTWHAKAIQNALGAVAEARKAGSPLQIEADILGGAAKTAISLVALAQGCLDAVADVAKRHGIDVDGLNALNGSDQIAGLKADLDAAEKEAARAIGEAQAVAQAAKDELAKLKADITAGQNAKAPAPPSPPAPPVAPTNNAK